MRRFDWQRSLHPQDTGNRPRSEPAVPDRLTGSVPAASEAALVPVSLLHHESDRVYQERCCLRAIFIGHESDLYSLTREGSNVEVDALVSRSLLEVRQRGHTLEQVSRAVENLNLKRVEGLALDLVGVDAQPEGK